MIDVTLLGTGGTMPLKGRWLTSCLIRHEGRGILIDCGEGTQIALRCAGKSVQALDLLCITHFHADHISGLPGLLLSMGVDGRTEPLTVCGPLGLERIVEGLRVIAPELPFALNFVELENPTEILNYAGLQITAFRVDHTLTCYGYQMHLARAGKFDPQKAKANGVPMKIWGTLQKQETAEFEGVTYTRAQVMGAARRGITVTYCTDTRPVPALTEYAQDADLLICEGMYGDDEKYDKAMETRHMLFSEAACIARDAKARQLWLTHYSPSLPNPEEYLAYVQEIFPETRCGEDGMNLDIGFTEE